MRKLLRKCKKFQDSSEITEWLDSTLLSVALAMTKTEHFVSSQMHLEQFALTLNY